MPFTLYWLFSYLSLVVTSMALLRGSKPLFIIEQIKQLSTIISDINGRKTVKQTHSGSCLREKKHVLEQEEKEEPIKDMSTTVDETSIIFSNHVSNINSHHHLGLKVQ